MKRKVCVGLTILLMAAFCEAVAGVPLPDSQRKKVFGPKISNSGPVELNEWTEQYDLAFAKSAETGRPMLVSIVNFGGDGYCVACKEWFDNVLFAEESKESKEKTPRDEWKKWLERYPLVLLMINYNDNYRLYQKVHSRYKGGLADTWPTLAIVAPGSTDILAKLDEDNRKKDIYTSVTEFTQWLGRYVYSYDITTVSFGTNSFRIAEGQTYTGIVSRTGCTYGNLSVTIVPGVIGQSGKISNDTIKWEDGEGGEKEFTYTLSATNTYSPEHNVSFFLSATNYPESRIYISTNTVPTNMPDNVGSSVTNPASGTSPGTSVTNVYETITTNVISLGSTTITYGITNLTLTVYDQLERESLADFIASRPEFSSLKSEGATWFIDTNEYLRCISTNRSGEMVESSLSWTAPSSGVFSTSCTLPSGFARLLLNDGMTNSVVTNNLNVGGTPLDSPLYRVGVQSGDTVQIRLTFTNSDMLVVLPEFSFEPFAPPKLTMPADGTTFQLDDIVSNPELVDIAWQAYSNDCATMRSYHLCYAASEAALTDTQSVAMAFSTFTNAVDAGIVCTTNAQGDLFLRCDVELETNAFDYAAHETLRIHGIPCSFRVIDIPEFLDPSPAEGSTVYGYLKTKSMLRVDADGPYSPITYAASGLPAGMGIDSFTGVISGSPKKVGSYEIRVMASTSSTNAVRRFTYSVGKMPEYVRAKAYGMLLDAATNLVGTVQLSVSSTAKLTAKVVTGAGKTAIVSSLTNDRSGLFAMVPVKGMTLSLDNSGTWTGTFGGYRIIARSVSSVSSFSDFIGYYTFTLMDAASDHGGYLTCTLQSKGKGLVKGVMPDKKSLSTSGFLFVCSSAEAARYGFPVREGDSMQAFLPILKTSRGQTFFGIACFSSASSDADFLGGTWANASDSTVLDIKGERYSGNNDFSSFDGMHIYGDGPFPDLPDPIATLRGGPTSLSAENSISPVSLRVTRRSGLFTVSFKINGKKATGKGVLLPSSATGSGIFTFSGVPGKLWIDE